MCTVLAVRLCMPGAASSCVGAGTTGECGVLCVTGSPSAQLQPLHIAHSSAGVAVAALDPVQLSMDDSQAAASSSSASPSSSLHRGVNAVEWSAQGRLLATAGWDGRVRLFSVSALSQRAVLSLRAVLPAHTAAAQCVAFAPSHTDAASSADSARTANTAVTTVSALSSAMPASLARFSHSSSLMPSARSLSPLFSRHSAAPLLLASGGDDQRVALYDALEAH